MNAQHTPGPWAYSEDGKIFTGNVSELLATAWFPKKMPDTRDERLKGESWINAYDRLAPQRALIKSEMKANARLIASAPDLLDALKQIANAGVGSVAPGFAEIAKAAIAKAEGL